MNDPRSIGISSKDANLIGLEAGSSQAFINKEYLSNFQYSKQIN